MARPPMRATGPAARWAAAPGVVLGMGSGAGALGSGSLALVVWGGGTAEVLTTKVVEEKAVEVASSSVDEGVGVGV